MPKVALYDMSGEQIGDMELNDSIFGVEVNKAVIHEVVVNYLANQRQGTQSTKTRAEVRGGGAKPWRQKGTGRARHGSSSSPIWRKGGVALGPKPRDYSYSVNKKVKRLALKSALSSKVYENDMMILDSLNFEEIKTKKMVDVLKNLNVDTKALVVLGQKDDVVIKSAGNIPGVKTTLVSTLNTYDIMNYDKLIATKEAIEKIEEVYA
jgi:large subunit ribosomal protein L4